MPHIPWTSLQNATEIFTMYLPNIIHTSLQSISIYQLICMYKANTTWILPVGYTANIQFTQDQQPQVNCPSVHNDTRQRLLQHLPSLSCRRPTVQNGPMAHCTVARWCGAFLMPTGKVRVLFHDSKILRVPEKSESLDYTFTWLPFLLCSNGLPT